MLSRDVEHLPQPHESPCPLRTPNPHRPVTRSVATLKTPTVRPAGCPAGHAPPPSPRRRPRHARIGLTTVAGTLQAGRAGRNHTVITLPGTKASDDGRAAPNRAGKPVLAAVTAAGGHDPPAVRASGERQGLRSPDDDVQAPGLGVRCPPPARGQTPVIEDGGGPVRGPQRAGRGPATESTTPHDLRVVPAGTCRCRR